MSVSCLLSQVLAHLRAFLSRYPQNLHYALPTSLLQRSSRNHEKSLDELAEETGTFALGLDPAAAGQTTPSPTFRHRPLSKSATPSPAIPTLPGVLAGNLNRIDLRRLGGGAQRLNSRALRVAQDNEAASE